MKVVLTDCFMNSLNKMYSPFGRFKSWSYYHNPFRKLRQIWQRGTRGYCNEDLWDMHDHLSKVIKNSLKGFRDSDRLGYPAGMSEKKWESTLDKMVSGWESLYNWDKMWMDVTETHSKNATGKTYTSITGKKEREMTKEEREKMNKEIDKKIATMRRNATLFIKHFNSLWD